MDPSKGLSLVDFDTILLGVENTAKYDVYPNFRRTLTAPYPSNIPLSAKLFNRPRDDSPELDNLVNAAANC